MISLAIILGVIVLLFFFLLLVKQFVPIRQREFICVLCGAISGTWLILLVLFWLGKFTNTTLLAVLMGSSVTGIYYLLDAKFPRWRIFRLPFFLSLILLVYSAVALTVDLSAYLFIGGVWLLFGLVFLYRRHPQIHGLGEKIVACCKNW